MRRWINEGDYNSTFFHKTMNLRFISNRIVALESSEIWIEEVEEVKHIANFYLEYVFQEPKGNKHLLEGVSFNQLSSE